MATPGSPEPQQGQPASAGAGPAPTSPSAPRPTSDLPTRINTPLPETQAPATAAPRGGTADPLLTRATSLGDSAGRATRITQLHVETAGEQDPAGTHRGEAWGDFVIGDLLGRGGMGAVYKGMQLSLDRPVAIKVLPQHLSTNESFRERFQLEAKAIAKLSSPQVIQVYAAGVHQGHHYFAMEFVEGRDLSRRLREGLRPSFLATLDLVAQAARGLAAAGELGIVHRDIKPANMMVTDRMQLKLMDFGLVKLASEQHGMTLSGTVMGTVSYFSPEQGRGERCDQRTDIYALGVVFYELLTGQLPFTGADATSIIYQHIHAAPRPPKEIDARIPEPYQAVVLKCLQKLPDDRYATAAALVSDLERLARDQPPSVALSDPALLRTGATMVKSPAFAIERRRPLLAVGVVAALAAAAVGTWAVLHGRDGGAAAAASSTSPASAGAPETRPAANPATPGLAPPSAAEVTPAQALDLVQAGRLEEARRVVDLALAHQPDDPDWRRTATAIDAAQGAALLLSVRQAIELGDIPTATADAAAAKKLIPSSPELATLLQRLEAHAKATSQRAADLERAENLLTAGDWAGALPILTRLDADQPGAREVTAALARARAAKATSENIGAAVHDQLANANHAMSQKDYDTALVGFTAVQQLEPQNAAAHDGLAAIGRIKDQIASERALLDAAVEKGDLAAAEAQLASRRGLAPLSAALAVAEQKVSQARLGNERARRAQEAREAKLSEAQRDLLARIDDPSQSLKDLAAAVATLTASWDPGRPERALLERRLADRAAHDDVAATLVDFDRAVMNADGRAVRAVVLDARFADALLRLKAYGGLVFASRLGSFERHGEDATAVVAITHALAVYPQRVLTYTFRLHRGDDAAWRIVAANLQQ